MIITSYYYNNYPAFDNYRERSKYVRIKNCYSGAVAVAAAAATMWA